MRHMNARISKCNVKRQVFNKTSSAHCKCIEPLQAQTIVEYVNSHATYRIRMQHSQATNTTDNVIATFKYLSRMYKKQRHLRCLSHSPHHDTTTTAISLQFRIRKEK